MANIPVMIITDDLTSPEPSSNISIVTDDLNCTTEESSQKSLIKAPIQQMSFKNLGAPPIGPPATSMLGADLKSFNNMPPPKLNVVKKSRVMVNPGRSMVEWMKIQQEQSTKGQRKLRKIGEDELSTHNQPGDVWMALNDKVYDVSDYATYHPGGFDEIMKGAGQDATNMFNKIHRWVNIESILKTNLLGYLVRHSTLSLVSKLKNQATLESSQLQQQLAPTIKFSEDEDSLFFEVDSDQEGEMGQECWTVGVLNRERFMLKVVIKPPDLWMTHLRLLKALQDDKINISFKNDFKRVLIKLKKPEKERWKALGAPLAENNKLLDSRGAIEDMYPAKLVRKQQLNYNVFLFTFQVAQSAIIGVPVGFHLRIRINGVCRKYTPASQELWRKSDAENSNNSQELYFIIKTYPNGGLTRPLSELPVNDSLSLVEIGCPGGSFDVGFLHDVENLCFLAAGSGITPFIRVLQYLLQRRKSVPIKRVILIFFNETADDIIWEDEWKKLAAEEPSWFYFYPVISKGGDEWKGLKGRISSEIFETCVTEAFKPIIPTLTTSTLNNKVIICGSYGFNDSCKQTIRQQKVLKIEESKGVYVFTG